MARNSAGGDYSYRELGQNTPSITFIRFSVHTNRTFLQYWDLRSPNPIATVALPERCYSMDVTYPLLVVATAERHIQVFNLTNPTTPFRVRKTPATSSEDNTWI